MTQKNATKWKFVIGRLTPTDIDTRTVMEARAQIEKMLRSGAQITDPITGRSAQVYDRGITRKMVEVLVVIYYLTKDKPKKYVGASELKTRGGDYGKLRHWGLIEQRIDLDASGTRGIRTPAWRVTPKGVRFVEGEISIPKKVLVFADRRVGFVDDKTVDFNSLMGGVDLKTILQQKGLK